MKKLTINQPKLTTSGDVSRVSCVIVEEIGPREKNKKTVTFDVDEKWGKYLVTENVNAYLVGLLPYAMRNQMDIELQAPVSSDLLHNIELYLVPHLVKYDVRLHHTRIKAKRIEPTRPLNSGGVGTGMSMGVDSFYTVHQYQSSRYPDMKLTHLLVEQVGDMVDGKLVDRYKRNVDQRTVHQVAEKLGLPVVFTYSNLRQVFTVNHYHTHTYLAMFNVHMLAKLFDTYFYSSGLDFSNFSLVDNSTHDAALHELLSLQALSTKSLRLVSGGAATDRIDKTKELANNDTARKFMRVCLNEDRNCMKCRKCRRTLLTLDMQDSLGKFKKVFNVPYYKENKEDYLKWLIRSYHKDSKGVSIKELYDFFYSKESETMKRLENWCLENYEPMKNPRHVRVGHKVQKVIPRTGKLLQDFIDNEEVYFVDKIYVNGVCYLRSEADSLKGVNCAIPMHSIGKA